MTNYYRIMLGKASVNADVAKAGGFIGTDFDINEDLSTSLPDNWREFNKHYIPIFLANQPGKTKVAAGLACGALWTVSKGILKGDIILSPDGTGSYMIGEVTGDYKYVPGEILPHRRDVRWFNSLRRDAMSQELQNSSGSIGTVSNITKYASELSLLIEHPDVVISTTDETIEDPTVFALERHLEDFLVHNWAATELGRDYNIYEVDGELVGRQYPSDTGPIDILAISKDHKTLLVVELKRGRASDAVVGQIQRYMGYVKDELLEDDQKVHGVIIALNDDLKLRRALSMAVGIDFMTYEVKFTLNKQI